jgi:transcriptional regulator with XRE-family HTH domain
MQESSFGQRIQSVRKRRGLTQTELARAAGLSSSLIRKLEQGTIADTRLETARKIAVALRVPTTVLVTEPDGEQADRTTSEQWEPARAALAGRSAEAAGQPTAEGVCDAVAAIRPALARNKFPSCARCCRACCGMLTLSTRTTSPAARRVSGP